MVRPLSKNVPTYRCCAACYRYVVLGTNFRLFVQGASRSQRFRPLRSLARKNRIVMWMKLTDFRRKLTTCKCQELRATFTSWFQRDVQHFGFETLRHGFWFLGGEKQNLESSMVVLHGNLKKLRTGLRVLSFFR